jgi:hypothetical protein
VSLNPKNKTTKMKLEHISTPPNDGGQPMSLRAYAAIHLKVPQSGLEWLDAMILEAKRDELAGQTILGMHAALQNTIEWPSESGVQNMARKAYQQADAMLQARNS